MTSKTIDAPQAQQVFDFGFTAAIAVSSAIREGNEKRARAERTKAASLATASSRHLGPTIDMFQGLEPLAPPKPAARIESNITAVPTLTELNKRSANPLPPLGTPRAPRLNLELPAHSELGRAKERLRQQKELDSLVAMGPMRTVHTADRKIRRNTLADTQTVKRSDIEGAVAAAARFDPFAALTRLRLAQERASVDDTEPTQEIRAAKSGSKIRP